MVRELCNILRKVCNPNDLPRFNIWRDQPWGQPEHIEIMKYESVLDLTLSQVEVACKKLYYVPFKIQERKDENFDFSIILNGYSMSGDYYCWIQIHKYTATVQFDFRRGKRDLFPELRNSYLGFLEGLYKHSKPRLELSHDHKVV